MYKRELKNGNIEYLEKFRDPLTGKIRYARVTIVPHNKRADDRAAREALDRKIADLLAQSGKVQGLTLRQIADKRVEWYQKNCKPQTAQMDAYRLRVICQLIGPDVLADRLSALVVSERLAADSPETYNERIKHFKSMMRWAYKSDLVPDISYLDKIQRRKQMPVREKDKYKYLEHDEISKLLEGMAVKKWRLLTEFLILSGLRIGEAMALENADVDLDRREITVNKTYVFRLGILSSTKTETSDRTVYMQDELLICCRKIKQTILLEEMKFAYRSELFIPDINTGSYISYDAYGKYFRENTERILGRRLTPHSLRHTHTAMLAEAGVPLEDISRRLGHADSRITRDVYMHVTNKMKSKARERIRKVTIIG